MRIKYLKTILTLLVFCSSANAQNLSETIITDRPDFTESALSLPSGITQFELGSTYTRFENENSVAAPETLIRYGFNDWIEARIGTPSWSTTRNNGSNSTSLDDGYFGFKFGLQRLASKYFDLSLIPAVTAPFGNQGSSTWNPELKICASSEVSEDFIFSTMSYIRSEVIPEKNREAIYQHTFSLGQSITDNLGLFYEYAFETYNDSRLVQIAHIGITYLVTADVQLDLHGGRNISAHNADPFIAAGVSFRY